MPEFLGFGSPLSVLASRRCFCLSLPYQRDSTTGRAQFLTHGTQFGEKNEETGDDGRFPNPHSAFGRSYVPPIALFEFVSFGCPDPRSGSRITGGRAQRPQLNGLPATDGTRIKHGRIGWSLVKLAPTNIARRILLSPVFVPFRNPCSFRVSSVATIPLLIS